MILPKVFHRIWVGPPMPDHLAAYGDTWKQHHPGWEHLLWTEANMPPLRNQALYDDAERHAPNHVGQFRADIARYELLAMFGGVYVDTDFECRRPLDPLLDSVTAFSAWEVPDVWAVNGILGATVGHPFMAALVAGLPANVARKAGSRPNKLSGPQYLTRVWRQGFADTVTVFAKDLFLPYLWSELERGGEDFPDAYAVHHWANARRKMERTT